MKRLFACFLFFIFPRILFAGGDNTKNIFVDPRNAQTNSDYNTLDSSKNELFHRSVYFQFNVSGLFSRLSDWKENLHLTDGTHPSSNCIVFAGESGFMINRYLQIGIGYEFFFTSKVTTIEVDDDQINGTFFYGTLKIGTFLKSLPEFYLFGSIDAGSISATEIMENYIIQNFERSGKATAYRFTIGAQYYTSENWSITAGIGYLSGNIRSVIAYGVHLNNFALDFSGLTLRGAINYHIPL